jgi:Domain of unknown function (DUF5655)
MTDEQASPAGLFAGSPGGLAVHDRVAELVAGLGDVESRVSRSQVAFRHGRGFAYVWRPGQYVRSDVPAVLSIALPREVASPRFKEVVHPSPHVWMHHLEVTDVSELDDEVRDWLREAWAHAAR